MNDATPGQVKRANAVEVPASNVHGTVPRVRATKVGAGTELAQIVKLLPEAQMTGTIQPRTPGRGSAPAASRGARRWWWRTGTSRGAGWPARS